MSAIAYSEVFGNGVEPARRTQWAVLLLTGFAGSTVCGLPSIDGALLLPLLLISAVTDLQSRRIPNWLTYGTLLVALATSAFISIMAAAGMNWAGVGIDLTESLAGFAATFGIMLLVYVLFGTGAGDVKLAGAIGACVGVEAGLHILLWTHIVAGCAMLVFVVWKIGPRWIAQQIGSRLFPHVIPIPVTDHSDTLRYPVPMALFFAIGTIAALLEVPLP